jgi:hypothetical protein
MAKQAADRRKSQRSGTEQAYEALVRYLRNGKYWHRKDLATRLKSDGHVQRVGYVMTKARRNGHVVVLGPEPGTYTSQPTGAEVLKDLRKRRKVSYAWIRNVQAVAGYALSNWGRVTSKLDKDAKLLLRAEIDYLQSMVPDMETKFQKAGLS